MNQQVKEKGPINREMSSEDKENMIAYTFMATKKYLDKMKNTYEDIFGYPPSDL